MTYTTEHKNVILDGVVRIARRFIEGDMTGDLNEQVMNEMFEHKVYDNLPGNDDEKTDFINDYVGHALAKVGMALNDLKFDDNE